MPKLAFKDLITTAAGFLVNEHGFSRTGPRAYARDDGLLGRRVWFTPGTSLPGSFRFDVLFALGLNGLSDLAKPRQLSWIVGCSGSAQRDESLPRLRFALTGDADHDLAVRDAVTRACRYVCDEFLLRHQTAEEFYQWLRAAAAESTLRPRPLDDLRKYHLDPSNSIPSFQTAAVYAAMLGRDAESAELEELAVEYARAGKMRDYVPGIRARIAQGRLQVAKTRGRAALDSFLPVLEAQQADALRRAGEADAARWISEADRQRELASRLGELLASAGND